MNRSALAFLLILSGCHQTQTAAPDTLPEGVYTMCEEVVGYSGETIELKHGNFRYWFYSDVVNENNPEPAYPLEGRYSVSGTTLSLDHPKIHSPHRTIATVNGVQVLWRDDGLKLWKSEERLHPYAVLIRVNSAESKRPSMSLLETAEMKERDRKEYAERHNEKPKEIRVLLRARSLEGDPDMETYKSAIARARAQPDPKLLAQIAFLLGRKSKDSIEVNSILEDLFTSTWLVPSPPPFLADSAGKKRAFEDLISSLPFAPDRHALEKLILAFLRASGVGSIDLRVPETGIRIVLEAGPNGGYRSDSEGTAVGDVDWLESMAKLVPACQEWMRSQLPK